MRPAHPVCLQQSRVPHVAFNMRNASMGTTADQNHPKCSCPVGSAGCRLGRSPLGKAAVQRGGDRSRRFRVANRERPRPLLCCVRSRSGDGLHHGEHLSTTKEDRQFARIVSSRGHLHAELSAPKPGDDEPLRHVVLARCSVRAEPREHWHVLPAHSRSYRNAGRVAHHRSANALRDWPRPEPTATVAVEMSLPSGKNGRVDDDVFIAVQGEKLVSEPRVYQAAE